MSLGGEGKLRGGVSTSHFELSFESINLKRQRNEFLGGSVGLYLVLVEVRGEVALCLTSLSQGVGWGWGVDGGVWMGGGEWGVCPQRD